MDDLVKKTSVSKEYGFETMICKVSILFKKTLVLNEGEEFR